MTPTELNGHQVTREDAGFIGIDGKGFDDTFLNLSHADICSLCANPWQIFSPLRERVWVGS